MTRFDPGRPLPAAVLGSAALLTIGWTGLLNPSLIRSIKATFDQTDAGIGLIYLLYSVAYVVGTFGGGPVVERLGRRRVLTLAAAVHGVGLVGLGLAPVWPVYVALTLPTGLGAGALDGGSNGLYLDLFRTGRGRAMSLLHVAFSVGALSAPLVVGALVDGGVAWPVVMVASGLAPLVLAGGFWLVSMPSGRATGAGGRDGSGGASVRSRFTVPLLLLGLGILTASASEIGVSSWLVRFLEPAPLSTATLALSLFWAGGAAGRLISARFADRFDHVRFTAGCALLLACALIGAIAAPSLPVSIALFALAGAGCGPIFPMVLAIGGARDPERSAAVSAVLAGFGVVGGSVYPSLMGLLSVTVGLTAAMFGNVVLGFACAAALLAVARGTRGDTPAAASSAAARRLDP